jgi:hypothetical protein
MGYQAMWVTQSKPAQRRGQCQKKSQTGGGGPLWADYGEGGRRAADWGPVAAM